MISLQWEGVEDTYKEFSPLYDSHYLEIYKHKVPVKKETLVALENSGALFLLTARDDNKPVGYYACVLSPSIYNSSVIEARDIGIYVIPKYRKLGVTTNMQEDMDKQLLSLGVRSVFVSYPEETTIPESMGYVVKEIVYGRVL